VLAGDFVDLARDHHCHLLLRIETFTLASPFTLG